MGVLFHFWTYLLGDDKLTVDSQGLSDELSSAALGKGSRLGVTQKAEYPLIQEYGEAI